ncbi:CLUMA_CG000900, isoform A [Clunio marinus]|uniref:CLUMA_CG000900, isoform A n=1 Tax=Clunio marinus TaxID=568069 RepID=A0A1J1HG94_9DIPT|nr:CLUMA_CG000900, isoform A [Clunio marinus]
MLIHFKQCQNSKDVQLKIKCHNIEPPKMFLILRAGKKKYNAVKLLKKQKNHFAVSPENEEQRDVP